MKIRSLLLFFLLIPVVVFCQNNFIIKGRIAKEYDGSKLYFGILNNNRVGYQKSDSVIIKNGTFYFEGKIDQVNSFASFTFRKGNLFYKKGFSLSRGTNDCNLIINSNKQLIVQMDASPSNLILAKIDSVHDEFILQYKKENNVKGSFALPTDLGVKLRNQQLDLLSKNSNSYISLLLLYHLSLFDSSMPYLDRIMKIYDAMPAEIRGSTFGLQFEKEKLEIRKANLATKISKPVPVFKIKKFDGTSFSNEQLKNKPYMIAFSATWCLPCQQYQPVLKKLYDKYHPKGFEVVYFNMDDNTNIWKQHVEGKKLNWINVSERVKWKDSKISKQFNIKGLPTYFIIDKNGLIIYNTEEMKDFNHSLIESYIVKSIQ